MKDWIIKKLGGVPSGSPIGRPTKTNKEVLYGVQECFRGFEQAITEGPSILEILLEASKENAKMHKVTKTSKVVSSEDISAGDLVVKCGEVIKEGERMDLIKKAGKEDLDLMLCIDGLKKSI